MGPLQSSLIKWFVGTFLATISVVATLIASPQL